MQALPTADKVRLDKWLWAARFYKTRALAAEEIAKGRVDVNGQAAKASRELHPGDLPGRQGARRVEARRPQPLVEADLVGGGQRLHRGAIVGQRGGVVASMPSPASAIGFGRCTPPRDDRYAFSPPSR